MKTNQRNSTSGVKIVAAKNSCARMPETILGHSKLESKCLQMVKT